MCNRDLTSPPHVTDIEKLVFFSPLLFVFPFRAGQSPPYDCCAVHICRAWFLVLVRTLWWQLKGSLKFATQQRGSRDGNYFDFWQRDTDRLQQDSSFLLQRRVQTSTLCIKLASDGDASSKRISEFYTSDIALARRDAPVTFEITSFVTIMTPLLLHLFCYPLWIWSLAFPRNSIDSNCIKLSRASSLCTGTKPYFIFL
jgi:hypothetical protein